MKDHDFTILEQTIRQDERNKVIEEVEELIKSVDKEYYMVKNHALKALGNKLNQLKEEG